MTFKKSKFKPKLNKILRLRENVLNSKRVLKLKKIKWENFIRSYQQKLKKYKKYKPYDQNISNVSKYPNRLNSYKKRYKDILHTSQTIRLFYGNISKKYLKRNIKILLKKSTKKISLNSYLIEKFEKKLDTVIYRAKFASSLREAQQMILHGKILVNSLKVKSKKYNLKEGDVVSVNLNDFNFVKKNIQDSSNRYLPPKHYLINYKTLQIIFGDTKNINLSFLFSFNLNIDKMYINQKIY